MSHPQEKSFMKENVYSISKVCLGLHSAGLFCISSLFPCLCPGGVPSGRGSKELQWIKAGAALMLAQC